MEEKYTEELAAQLEANFLRIQGEHEPSVIVCRVVNAVFLGGIMGRGKERRKKKSSHWPALHHFLTHRQYLKKKGGKDIVTTKVLGHDRVTRLRDSRPLLR